MNIQSYGPNITKQSLKLDAAPQDGLAQHTGEQEKGNFANVLQQYATDMNHDVKSAAKDAEKLAITGEGNMSETLLAMKEADLSFQLMLSARNKLMDAYREVIRMQV